VGHDAELLTGVARVVWRADAEQLWSVEIARRVKELDEGTARTVPWSEVQRQLHEPRAR